MAEKQTRAVRAVVTSLLFLALLLGTLLPASVYASTGYFGNNGDGTHTGGLPNILVATKYHLSENAIVTQIGGYASAPGHWKLGIYEDNAGSPGTLLTANNDVNAVVAGDNQFNIGPVSLAPGDYWLAILTDTNNRRYNLNTGQAAYIQNYGFSNNLPATFGAPTGTQPNDYVEYATYTTTSIATAITVSCAPPTVPTSGSMQTTISGKLSLSSDPSAGICGKNIALSYHDGSSWVAITTACTNIDGEYTANWVVPESLTNGFYPVKATFSGDACYDASEAFTTTEEEGLLKLPEYMLGALAAMLVCLCAFMFYKKRKSPQMTTTQQLFPSSL